MFRGNRDYEYNSPIDVKDNVKTVVTTVPKVPHELKTKLENKLKRMVDLNIIQPIEKPTDWVISLVILKKNKFKVTYWLRSSTYEQRYKMQTTSLSH